jgi:hypothetical protein
MIHYLSENWAEVAGILAAVHILALAIVNATPTPRDDEIYGKLYKVVEVIAGIITRTAKK